jgi:hypothetical protein
VRFRTERFELALASFERDWLNELAEAERITPGYWLRRAIERAHRARKAAAAAEATQASDGPGPSDAPTDPTPPEPEAA